MKDMTHTEIIDVRLSAKPGASLGECMRDAVLLACQEWQNVTLIHNGKDYRVLCNDLLGCVEEMNEECETSYLDPRAEWQSRRG